MVTSLRMKVDLAIQGLFLLIILTEIIVGADLSWLTTTLVFLLIWQLISSLQLLLIHQYQEKIFFVIAGITSLLAYGLWNGEVGQWAFLALSLPIGWYLYHTIRDTITVINRPRSFWDIF